MTDLDIETHPLAPFLPPNAKLLMLGSFPPPEKRWKMPFYYPNYQNDMWRIMGLVFYQNAEHFLDVENKTFKKECIVDFLTIHGIAIYDTAYQVQRLQGNASDKHLQVITPTNIHELLKQIPECRCLMTTGEKATELLIAQCPPETALPKIDQPVYIHAFDRVISLYRMPSSSRAYPLSLQKKAGKYSKFFSEIGLI